MMSAEVYNAGVLRQRWNASTRLYTEWDEQGVQTLQRPYTAEENDAADARDVLLVADGNKRTIEERGITALTDNQTYLNIASPTNAQSAAQVKALTRQVNGLIRLALGRLESAD